MIELYSRDDCPFCQKVIAATAELGLRKDKDFIIMDAAPGTPGRDEVLRIGGKAMVPFLVDGEVSMYESDDIINYLKARQ